MEAIAAALREGGHEVDLQPVRKVRSLEGYGLVMLPQARRTGS